MFVCVCLSCFLCNLGEQAKTDIWFSLAPSHCGGYYNSKYSGAAPGVGDFLKPRGMASPIKRPHLAKTLYQSLQLDQHL